MSKCCALVARDCRSLREEHQSDRACRREERTHRLRVTQRLISFSLSHGRAHGLGIRTSRSSRGGRAHESARTTALSGRRTGTSESAGPASTQHLSREPTTTRSSLRRPRVHTNFRCRQSSSAQTRSPPVRDHLHGIGRHRHPQSQQQACYGEWPSCLKALSGCPTASWSDREHRQLPGAESQ